MLPDGYIYIWLHPYVNKCLAPYRLIVCQIQIKYKWLMHAIIET